MEGTTYSTINLQKGDDFIFRNKTTFLPLPWKWIYSWRNKFYKIVLSPALHMFHYAGWVTHSTLLEQKK